MRTNTTINLKSQERSKNLLDCNTKDSLSMNYYNFIITKYISEINNIQNSNVNSDNYTTKCNKIKEIKNDDLNNSNASMLINDRRSFKEMSQKYKSIECIDIFFDAIKLKDCFISNFSTNSPLNINSIYWSLYILYLNLLFTFNCLLMNDKVIQSYNTTFSQ